MPGAVFLKKKKKKKIHNFVCALVVIGGTAVCEIPPWGHIPDKVCNYVHHVNLICYEYYYSPFILI